jgi:hypothetical protein
VTAHHAREGTRVVVKQQVLLQVIGPCEPLLADLAHVGLVVGPHVVAKVALGLEGHRADGAEEVAFAGMDLPHVVWHAEGFDLLLAQLAGEKVRVLDHHVLVEEVAVGEFGTAQAAQEGGLLVWHVLGMDVVDEVGLGLDELAAVVALDGVDLVSGLGVVFFDVQPQFSFGY